MLKETRRRKEPKPFLPIGLAVGLLALALFFDYQVNQPQVNESFSPAFADIPQAQIDVVVQNWYPEIKAIKPRAAGSFTTPKGMALNWLNFSTYKFNPEAAARLYAFLQRLVTGDALRLTMNHRGTDIRIFILQRGDTTIPIALQKSFLILPEDAPQSEISNFGGTFPSAGSHMKGNDPIVSYVVTRPNLQAPVARDAEGNANKGFATEACHQSIVAGTPPPGNLANVAQEVFCNSFAIAAFYRQQGLDYNEYVQMARRLRLTTFNANAIALGKPIFERIPGAKIISK